MDNNKVEFEDDEKLGVYYIWKTPNPSHSYVIGADPSAGIGRDSSVAYVIDRQSRETVAKIDGQLEPVPFAEQLFKLSKYYNNAYMNIEINNHGLTVIERLKSLGFYKFYRRKTFDDLTNAVSTRIGFQTTNENKLRITDNYKNACRAGDIIILDPGLIDEMSTFVQLSSKNGRTLRREAIAGCKDDRVMSICLALEMDKELPNLDYAENEFSDIIESVGIDSDTGFPIFE
jgi:hypothetical protein